MFCSAVQESQDYDSEFVNYRCLPLLKGAGKDGKYAGVMWCANCNIYNPLMGNLRSIVVCFDFVVSFITIVVLSQTSMYLGCNAG